MTDIRVQRTYALLCDTLTKLLKEKDFESVTVSEICQQSTVQRGTFYRHFEDKNDFFRYYLTTMTESFLAQAQAVGKDLEDIDEYARDMMIMLMDFIRENRRIVRHALLGNAPVSVVDMASAQIAIGITERIERRAEQTGIEPPIPAGFIGRFYAGGMMQVIRWQIEGTLEMTNDELERYSNAVLSSCLQAPA